MRKIRIAHLIPSLRIGGAEKVVLDISKHLNSDKFEILILYWNDDDQLVPDFLNAGAKVIKLKLGRVISLRSVIAIFKLLKTENVDILHTHFIDSDFLGSILAKIMNIPVVFHIHSFPFPEKKTHILRYRILSFVCRKIICVSETAKKHILMVIKVNSNKVNVIYNGINQENIDFYLHEKEKISLKKSLGINTNEIVVGNVARLVPEKNHKNIILSARQILKKNPNIKFLFVGDGIYKDELISFAKKNNVNGNVIFAGLRTDIMKVLSIMDLFIFPGFTEAMGVAILEAMAAGLPIIAANDGGIVELIEDKKDGILIDPNSVEQLSLAIDNFLINPQFAKNLGNSAKEKVKNFLNDNMIQKIQSIYTEISR